MEYTCRNCNKKYYSYKENSKFCSKECKNKYNNILYSCDYCKKEFYVFRSNYEKLLTGEKKHLYCSKECADKGNYTSVEKICQNCGKIFTITNAFKDIQKFCSKECFYDYKRKNSINGIKTCPTCSNNFAPKHKDQIYCCRSCAHIGLQLRETCTCDYCGKEFDRKKSEVNKNKRHYCSNECRMSAIYWNKNDIEILINNYNKLSSKEIKPILTTQRSVNEINRKAISLGLTSSREWSKEEIKILCDNYSKVPIKDLMKLLPDRTYTSICGKARGYNLKSYFYLTHNYTEKENEYLKNNYLNKTNKELSIYLNRTEIGIEQHLWVMKLKRPKEIAKYLNLERYVRARIVPWRNNFREENNFTCALTGVHSNIIVHHIRSFNLIFNEVIEMLDFPYYDSIEKYNIKDLDSFVNTFLYMQEYYNSCICINEQVHLKFHKIYGYGYNTEEQWKEFIEKYYNNT